MNKRQKEVIGVQLSDEQQTIKELKQVYRKAQRDVEANISALLARTDTENLASIVYQVNYQRAILKQIEGTLDVLNTEQFTSISGFLGKSYANGYLGVMYDLQGQGIPIIAPIDNEMVVKALQTDSKISNGLYSRLGVDTKELKDSIRANLSRGVSSGASWDEIARNINARMNIGLNRSIRIARTEGHRVQCEAGYQAQQVAKSKGADVVKQWCATLDGRTRPNHRLLDGVIKPIDEPFEIDGNEAMYPADFGVAREDVNCRCTLLQRAKWALDADELKTLEDRAAYFGLDKTADFSEYKRVYMGIDSTPQKSLDDLKREYNDAEDELNRLQTQLNVRDYKERKIENLNLQYSDVYNLNEQEIEELRKKSSERHVIDSELQKVSDEFYNSERPDRRTQPEKYREWRERHDALSERLNQLTTEQNDAYNAESKLKRYDNYIRYRKSIDASGILTKAEIEDRMDVLKRNMDDIRNNPLFFDELHKSNTRKLCEKMGVEYVPLKSHANQPSIDEIIERVGGGDETEGSCASLGFAYAAQRNGFDVLDFRDGQSRKVFANSERIYDIANLDKVKSKSALSHTPMKDAVRFLNEVEEGKEYYFTSYAHAAIVRKNNGHLQYLELQSGNSKGYVNGWHDFTNPFNYDDNSGFSVEDALKWRFNVPKTKSTYNCRTTIIEIDSLKGNKEFENLLGYINTDESKQRKSKHGTIK